MVVQRMQKMHTCVNIYIYIYIYIYKINNNCHNFFFFSQLFIMFGFPL